MLVGIDFDNTIVCYDQLFHKLANELVGLPPHVATTKGAVRDYLRSIGRENDWTAMQGVGYGPRISDAQPFPAIKDFLSRCRSAGVEIAVISHKTKNPYLGPKYDLHEAALTFLTTHGFFETEKTGLKPSSVYLELTKDAKLQRIGQLGCDVFIDDLPEFLGEAQFPTRPLKILFDPADACSDRAEYRRAKSWADVSLLVLGDKEGRWAA